MDIRAGAACRSAGRPDEIVAEDLHAVGGDRKLVYVWGREVLVGDVPVRRVRHAGAPDPQSRHVYRPAVDHIGRGVVHHVDLGDPGIDPNGGNGQDGIPDSRKRILERPAARAVGRTLAHEDDVFDQHLGAGKARTATGIVHPYVHVASDRLCEPLVERPISAEVFPDPLKRVFPLHEVIDGKRNGDCRLPEVLVAGQVIVPILEAQPQEIGGDDLHAGREAVYILDVVTLEMVPARVYPGLQVSGEVGDLEANLAVKPAEGLLDAAGAEVDAHVPEIVTGCAAWRADLRARNGEVAVEPGGDPVGHHLGAEPYLLVPGAPSRPPAVVVAVDAEDGPVREQEVAIAEAEVYLGPVTVVEAVSRVEKEYVLLTLPEGDEQVERGNDPVVRAEADARPEIDRRVCAVIGRIGWERKESEKGAGKQNESETPCEAHVDPLWNGGFMSGSIKKLRILYYYAIVCVSRSIICYNTDILKLCYHICLFASGRMGGMDKA